MSAFVTPILQRTLSAVYRFYDVFFFPLDDTSPPVTIPLDVSILALRLTAQHAPTDATYRFSALTLTQPAPTGVNLDVQVSDSSGQYTTLQPIQLTLPRPLQ